MKKYICLILTAFIVLSLSACKLDNNEWDTPSNQNIPTSDLGDDNLSFGTDLEDAGIFDGYFEEDTQNIEILCVSGTKDAYKIENDTITFTNVSEDSVYSISGQFKGNIVIDIGDGYKFDLEMRSLSLISKNINPITVLSGNKVSLTAKNEYKNYIYDNREAIEDETLYSGAIYSLCDLEICGKGELTIVSQSNNGIHSKNDLEVKNLTLFVSCVDNALKGNDSVTIESGNLTLIATQGDGIKTTNSNISDKGNQRGTISILGGTHTIYSACDGIDASYNVIIDNESTILNIYTDKYSNYSEEITDVSENVYYIRFTSSSYSYSVKYYNSDKDYTWVNAEYHSKVSGGRSNYYYYSLPKLAEYEKLQFFIYTSDMEQGQDTDYYLATELLTPNTAYDTFALTSYGYQWGYSWTNYTTQIQGGGFGSGHGGPGGMGGMNDGNTDKGDHSTKGIKASNEIQILNGTINIKAYDDAIHANNDTTLENSNTPTGNIIVNNGIVTIYSNDDGIHADGTLTIQNGTITISNSYEGLEGSQITIDGGFISVISKDDGINATNTSNTAITINGGTLYVYAGGDGIDSNSRASYQGILFNGGNTVVISTSGGNSAIDTESGYTYNGGRIVAIMPSGGMSSEATHASNFSSIGASKSASLSSGDFLTIKAGGNTSVTIKMPCSLNGKIIYLGNNSISVSTENESDLAFDSNNIFWY